VSNACLSTLWHTVAGAKKAGVKKAGAFYMPFAAGCQQHFPGFSAIWEGLRLLVASRQRSAL
jgi:hypothetical protein